MKDARFKRNTSNESNLNTNQCKENALKINNVWQFITQNRLT